VSTAALGGHVDQCDACGHQALSYNSCRNRHCPKCQAQARERWLAARGIARGRRTAIVGMRVFLNSKAKLAVLDNIQPKVLLIVIHTTDSSRPIIRARSGRWHQKHL
jgi:Transposase zinc-binding domain